MIKTWVDRLTKQKTVFTIVIIAFFVLCLSPLAQLLRTQQPWKCFIFTGDENYYSQAIHHYAQGEGFRISPSLPTSANDRQNEALPFDATITIGVPQAWGTIAVAKLTGYPIAVAGRVFVHLCFWLFLIGLAIVANRRAKSVTGILPVAIFFGLFFPKLWGGSYVVFGLLGEIPAALAMLAALFFAERRVWALAGVFSVLAFILKPTFLFFIPAICIGIFIRDRLKGVYCAMTAFACLLAGLFYVSQTRGESIPAYIEHYLAIGRSIARLSGKSGIWGFFVDYPFLVALMVLSFLPLIYAGIRKSLRTSEWTAIAFVAIAVLFFIIDGHRPQAKHFLVFLLPLIAVSSLRIAEWIRKWSETLAPFEPVILGVALSLIIAWTINVPSIGKKIFENSPRTSCAVHEQIDLMKRVNELVHSNAANRENLFMVSEVHSVNIVYDLAWNPPRYQKVAQVPMRQDRWIYGDRHLLVPATKNCAIDFSTDTYALIHCTGPST